MIKMNKTYTEHITVLYEKTKYSIKKYFESLENIGVALNRRCTWNHYKDSTDDRWNVTRRYFFQREMLHELHVKWTIITYFLNDIKNKIKFWSRTEYTHSAPFLFCPTPSTAFFNF